MKRNISDLLDGYPADVDLDSPTPLSPFRIEELTMEKLTAKSKRKRRVPLRALAVAAVIAALGGSALAVGQTLGAWDWFRPVFNPEGGALTDAQLNLMDEMGQTFEGPDGAAPAAVTCNGATITPLAALADENVYYLRLRVEAPEGTALPDLDGETEGYYQLFGKAAEEKIDLEFDESAYPRYGYSLTLFWLTDADPTDNVKEAVLRFVKQSDTDLSFNDGVSKSLTIHGLWIQSPDKKYTPIFTGEFSFDIGLSYESKVVSLDCGRAIFQNELYGFTNVLDSLELSPLSVTFGFRSTLAENDWVIPGVGEFQIVLKDGTVFWPKEDVWDENRHPLFDDESVKDDFVTSYVMTDVFDEPLDLEQVDYIRYGENQIDLGK